jgi:hypothetical protein
MRTPPCLSPTDACPVTGADVALDNQFADVGMIRVLGHLSCAMNQRGGHDDAQLTSQLH